MTVRCERALLEVQLQLELDEQRGVPLLAPRARALQEARASGDLGAQRQALIDVAAACVAMAASLPAPIQALDDRALRGTVSRFRRPAKASAGRKTTGSGERRGTAGRNGGGARAAALPSGGGRTLS